MELRCIRLGLRIVVGLASLLPGQPSALAADPALEARIDQCSREMTLEQKAGQLNQADIGSITSHDLRHYPLGSIQNGDSSSPGNHEFAPPSEWLAPADRFYEASRDCAHGAVSIPTRRRTDAAHGHNNLAGATIFAHNIAR
jgi:beta-glucosidase